MIILAGTPLGNTADASSRLCDTLRTADLIAAEDTRRLLNLVARLGLEIHAPVVAYHDHNEEQKAPDLVQAAARGQRVVVVSDAGMPAISDPGYRLVSLAAARGVQVTAVPGPCAAVTAIALSGLPSDRFTFEGFLPRKSGERAARLAELRADVRTLVFYESAKRLEQTLKDMADVFGEKRPAVVAREMTKTHEQVRRGTLGDLALWAQGNVLGEIVIVVQGARENKDNTAPEYVDEVRQLHEEGLRLKVAAAHVARREGLSAKALYDAACEAE